LFLALTVFVFWCRRLPCRSIFAQTRQQKPVSASASTTSWEERDKLVFRMTFTHKLSSEVQFKW
jgi:hypothetical protein